MKWTSKLSYLSQKIFDKDLVAIRKSKATLTLNKPAYVEMCILDLSKVLMYQFHYDYIKNKCGNKFLGDNSREHGKATGTNKNVVTISHGEYKDVSLNKKCSRHSMNRIESKDLRIETYEFNKISLS